MRDRVSTKYFGPDKTKVRGYLLVRQLRRLVSQAFAELRDERAFWLAKEFNVIRTKRANERDRLTLENVLGRLSHCVKPDLTLRQFQKVAAGKLTLESFIKTVLGTHKG